MDREKCDNLFQFDESSIDGDTAHFNVILLLILPSMLISNMKSHKPIAVICYTCIYNNTKEKKT